jgi:hypothetical protein
MTIPACQPRARPPRGSAIDSTSSPLRAMSQEIVEFEFHISPALSSSRPQTGVGTFGTSSSSRRAQSALSLSRCGLSTASSRSGIKRRASVGSRSGRARGDPGVGRRPHLRRRRHAPPPLATPAPARSSDSVSSSSVSSSSLSASRSMPSSRVSSRARRVRHRVGWALGGPHLAGHPHERCHEGDGESADRAVVG